MNNRIKLPNYDERAIFLGGTGSGKTNLAMTMADQYDKFVYIDCQHNLEPKADSIYISKVDRLTWDLAFLRDRHIVFRPKIEDQTPQMFNNLLKMLHTRGRPRDKRTGKFPRPFTIYIDEAYSVGYASNFPHWATKIAVLDRQKGIGLWTASQRPVNIPIPLRSECAYYYVFYLSYEDDIREIAKYGRPKKQLEEMLTHELKFDHSFIQISRKTGEFIHRPPIPKY